jgi:hypothetical protein
MAYRYILICTILCALALLSVGVLLRRSASLAAFLMKRLHRLLVSLPSSDMWLGEESSNGGTLTFLLDRMEAEDVSGSEESSEEAAPDASVSMQRRHIALR